jgi:hypothetical protein
MAVAGELHSANGRGLIIAIIDISEQCVPIVRRTRQASKRQRSTDGGDVVAVEVRARMEVQMASTEYSWRTEDGSAKLRILTR